MKIVQSFWSLPALNSLNPSTESFSSKFNGGWLRPKYFWMSWALSCLKLRQFYDEVELVTDEIGKKILIDQLKLPYTKVSVCLDKLNHYPTKLWALGKLYTYQMQDEPFIHVDSDVFIWKKFGPSLENSKLIVQSLENENEHSYYPQIKQIFQHFDYIPNTFWKHCSPGKKIIGVNAGILGGRDIDFIQYYTKEAFSFVDANQDKLPQLDMGLFNTVYEQLLFYYLAKEQNKDISYYFKFTEDKIKPFYTLAFLPHRLNYIHVMGTHKKKSSVCQHLEARLAFEFPVFYDHLCRILEIPEKDQADKKINQLKNIYENEKKICKKTLFNFRFQLLDSYDYEIVNVKKQKNGNLIKDLFLMRTNKETKEYDSLSLVPNYNELLLHFTKPTTCNDLFPIFRENPKYDYLNDKSLKTKLYQLIIYHYLFSDMLTLVD